MLGYRESLSLHSSEALCVLSASGTAVRLVARPPLQTLPSATTTTTTNATAGVAADFDRLAASGGGGGGGGIVSSIDELSIVALAALVATRNAAGATPASALGDAAVECRALHAPYHRHVTPPPPPPTTTTTTTATQATHDATTNVNGAEPAQDKVANDRHDDSSQRSAEEEPTAQQHQQQSPTQQQQQNEQEQHAQQQQAGGDDGAADGGDNGDERRTTTAPLSSRSEQQQRGDDVESKKSIGGEPTDDREHERGAAAVQCVPCAMCGSHGVPALLLATIDAPPFVPIVGGLAHVEARVCRAKKDAKGDVNATFVSEALPFLEFDLHRQLLYKLRLLGCNAAFSLRIDITVGSDMIVGVASATAALVAALPEPRPLRISLQNISASALAAARATLLPLPPALAALATNSSSGAVGSSSDHDGGAMTALNALQTRLETQSLVCAMVFFVFYARACALREM